MPYGRGRIFISACIVLLLMMHEVGCQPQPTDHKVFDVKNFNAVGDGTEDDAMALIRAWVAACRSGAAAKVLIPPGNFMASEVVFAGPCTATKPIIVEIQGTLLANTDLSSYSQGAWISIERVDGLLLTGPGTIDGRGKSVWKYGADSDLPLLPVALSLKSVENAKVGDLKFVNSMGFHLEVRDSKNIDISKVGITAPGDSPFTHGIHLTNSTNVKITDSVIGTGDDCVSIDYGTQSVLVAGVTCGPGHGLSVGSLGKLVDETNVNGITVTNCTLVKTKNGARIRSYHDSPKIEATNIVFEHLVMEGVQNPILIDQHYNSKDNSQQSSVRLSDIHFRDISGTSTSPIAINLNCSSLVPCEKVELANINLKPFDSTIKQLTSACSNAQIITQGQIFPSMPNRCT
ncbi:exopolygalacturonase clone GBGE184-like [Salvia hispanica]|uniref:exopolygalacturonase clone GBGE184-like n=1 Tax=Salvia hispanica TaxID=49212 RepID=UPI002008FB1C|nr:exopolygalacturonase clone GBGE184-like [Salvia hispanica]